MKIFENIRRWWNEKRIITGDTCSILEYDYTRPSEMIVEKYLIEIPEIQIIKVDDTPRPGILLMDDISGMTALIRAELGRVQCCEVVSEFNLAIADGDYAGFIVQDFLKNNDDFIINVAFLDITLGGVIDGVEFDGVDVAIMIKEKFPDSIIKFITGHTLNRRNPEIFKFIEKFENHFSVSIDETENVIIDGVIQKLYKHVIGKNSNRVFSLGMTIEEFLDKSKNSIHRVKRIGNIGGSGRSQKSL